MKSIVVTGASGGIGRSICDALHAAGHKVIPIEREQADLGVFKDIHSLATHTIEDNPHIDWIICAHGFIDTEMVLEKQSPENIAATLNINTLSIMYIAQQFLPHIAAGGGIISLSSSAGLQANGRFSVYSASKAAVNSFMQALARNRPEQKFFAVCPGPTNTTMRERIAGDAAKMQGPDVVAEVVASLVAGDAEYKSGDLILVKDAAVSIASRV